jgi:hypothetical protein
MVVRFICQSVVNGLDDFLIYQKLSLPAGQHPLEGVFVLFVKRAIGIKNNIHNGVYIGDVFSVCGLGEN